MRLISLLFLLTSVYAIPILAAGNATVGETLYGACAACHGAQGEGNRALGAPRLNHLDSVYIEAQLLKFRQGIRGGAGAASSAVQMAGMANTLADEKAVADVSAFIAGLDSAAPAVTVQGDATLGGDYFNQFCGACHGPTAEGNTALNSPRLAGSDDWYLMAQLEAFRSGARGSHPDDRTGRQMRAMAGVLPDAKAVRDVVAFIGSLAQ